MDKNGFSIRICKKANKLEMTMLFNILTTARSKNSIPLL